MEHIAVWQIALLTLYSGLAIYDGNNTTLGLVKPSMAGFFAGLIMGDMTTGLIVGGTLNLLVLGVGNFGGASTRRLAVDGRQCLDMCHMQFVPHWGCGAPCAEWGCL